MMRTICADADLQVNDDSTIRVGNAQACRDPNGACRCICHLVSFGRTVTVRVNNNLARFGGGVTHPDDFTQGAAQRDGTPSAGTGSSVEVETQNRWQAMREDDPTQFVDEPDWLILAHELCGHALHLMRGDHARVPPQEGALPYPENHRQATDAGAAIRAEKGLPAIDQQSVRER
jgi:hypothetical protein